MTNPLVRLLTNRNCKGFFWYISEKHGALWCILRISISDIICICILNYSYCRFYMYLHIILCVYCINCLCFVVHL